MAPVVCVSLLQQQGGWEMANLNKWSEALIRGSLKWTTGEAVECTAKSDTNEAHLFYSLGNVGADGSQRKAHRQNVWVWEEEKTVRCRSEQGNRRVVAQKWMTLWGVHVNLFFSSFHRGHVFSSTSSAPSLLQEAGGVTPLPGDRQPPSTGQSEALKNRPLLGHWSAAPRNSLRHQWLCHCVVWQCWSQLYCPSFFVQTRCLQRTPFTHIRASTQTPTSRGHAPSAQSVTARGRSLGIRRIWTYDKSLWTDSTGLNLSMFGFCCRLEGWCSEIIHGL